MSTPVNRFPDFVRHIVTSLKATCPILGVQRIANLLARAGLHRGRTTVRRFRLSLQAQHQAQAHGVAP